VKRLAARALWVAALGGLVGCVVPKQAETTSLSAQLEREVQALRLRVAEVGEGDACEPAGTDSLYASLVQVFADMDVSVDKADGAVRVTMAANYLFAERLTLRGEASGALDLLATALLVHPNTFVVIEGHTRDAPPATSDRAIWPTNWELSYARAWVVMKALAGFGVPERRFAITGASGNSPIATNDTVAGQTRNERVEIYLRPQEAAP
jgi:flagellar motor protein MotB